MTPEKYKALIWKTTNRPRTPEERLKMNCMIQPPTPVQWMEKYIHDWFLWNGIAFLAVGVIGCVACVIALLTK